jgi:hypothetical protein
MTPHEKIIQWMVDNPGIWTANEILMGCGFAGGAHSASRYLSELADRKKLVCTKELRGKRELYVYRLPQSCIDAAAQMLLRSRPPAEITGARFIDVRHSEPVSTRPVNAWKRANGAPC